MQLRTLEPDAGALAILAAARFWESHVRLLLVAAGDTFYVKRLLQRLDRDELTISQAADLISATNARLQAPALRERSDRLWRRPGVDLTSI